MTKKYTTKWAFYQCIQIGNGALRHFGKGKIQKNGQYMGSKKNNINESYGSCNGFEV